ncbi:hypothetical protein [Cecembia rubra]|uniref:Uncharacterized protein n=1 Tax=Cecembia rubra TaxID=1485585 RepID=A0A2P8DXH0_9BACT|nr:hypothetical protein [Cecembia rubra]PSL01919.1 hypothetical protein CLV48_1117 [Cecembia rubra]
MKGKRNTSETQYLSWKAIQRGQLIPNVAERVYSFLMENRPNEYSAKELESLIGIEDTTLSQPLVRLQKTNQVGFVKGHHEFSKNKVKKYYAKDMNDDPQQKLF